jgi:hypothetical protein
MVVSKLYDAVDATSRVDTHALINGLIFSESVREMKCSKPFSGFSVMRTEG